MIWNPLCVSLSLSPDLSSVSSRICTIPPSFSLPCREDCLWGPETEEGSPDTGPHWEDPTSAPTCGATAQTHTAPREPWVNMHPHAQAHTDRVTNIFFFFLSFPLNLLCCIFHLTSFHSPFPQVLPLSLCQLMSSKMTSPPRPLSDMAVTNHQAFLHWQGSQVTNYWVTSQLWARPLTTAPVMLRWGNNSLLLIDSWVSLCWQQQGSLINWFPLITSDNQC